MLAADLPEEFTAPVGYGDRWVWLAVLGLVLVAGYYAAVWWVTRVPAPDDEEPVPTDVELARSEALRLIDAIETDAAAGRITRREAHQRLSRALRGYVAAVSDLPATTMALADFREAAPRPLVAAIALMYPPEFAPDPDSDDTGDGLDDALTRARRLVRSWG